MGSWFSKLFRKRESNKNISDVDTSLRTTECIELLELENEIHKLCEKNHYVAKSEFIDVYPKYQKVVEYFTVLAKSRMLDAFCAQHQMSSQDVVHILDLYNSLNEIVEQANDEYIAEHLVSDKEYLDKILYEVDPLIKLDDDQRKVVLTDEDYCLVIAGAGAGKTTTVAAKVKYLVEKKNIDPKDILVISFTNKAVLELKERINDNFNIPCDISTFHSFAINT